ncbi:MAG: signal peptidase I [Candidatus Aenigmarchaeota archaeon]|nr:signal peptidase I [Candidatus Aenigmarchaeota archaeon]
MKIKVRDFIDFFAAIAAAFIFYKLLTIATGSSTPIVSVASSSMIPNLYPGDLVFAIEAKNLKIGDIIIYRANCYGLPKKDIIHRIIKFEDSKIITKGDNNPIADPCPIEKSQIKGKVIFAIPLLGWPRLLLSYIGIE